MDPSTDASRSWNIAIVAVAALAVGVVAYALGPLIQGAGDPSVLPTGVVAAIVVGALTCIVAGLGIGRDHTLRRTAVWLIVLGAAWSAGWMWMHHRPVAYVIGLMLMQAHLAVCIHLLLAFPRGRCEGRARRSLDALAWAGGIAAPIASYMVVDTRRLCGCWPTNPFMVADSLTAYTLLLLLTFLLLAIAAIGSVIALVRGWARSEPWLRRGWRPVLWSGAATLVLLVAALLGQFGMLPGISGPEGVSGVGVYFAPLAVIVIAVGCVLGATSSRLWWSGRARRLVLTMADGRVDIGDGGVQAFVDDALGTSSVQVGYWSDATSAYVDAEGAPLRDVERAQAVPVRYRGRDVGMLHSFDPATHSAMLESIAPAIAVSMANERLTAELRARVRELEEAREHLRRSRERVVNAADTARRQFERDLHDGAQQQIVAVLFQLELARCAAVGGETVGADALRAIHDQLTGALDGIRSLARGIHSVTLAERGLPAAIAELAGTSVVPVSLDFEANGRLSCQRESALYLVAAEAMANASKHARPDGIRISLRRVGAEMLLRVVDDGCGGADPSRGSGLDGLRDRIEVLDGSLEIVSAPGDGTTVEARIPCES